MNELTFAEDVQERKRRMLPMTFGAMSSPGGTLTTTVQPGQAPALPNTLGLMRQRLGTVQQQLDELDSKDVDMSALQDFARQQGQAGEMATLNALAAQFAGEGFQPVQAQFLRRAAAAAEPMKVGGGMLTPQGQFIKDPVAARDTRRAALERQALGLERSLTEQERAEQARQDRIARDDVARLDRLTQQDVSNQFRRDSLSLQERIAEMRRDLAANRPKDESKNFRVEDNLRNEYLKRADKIREGTGHAQNVITLLSDPTTARDATKQVALVFAFGKMLDPESVVREAEQQMIANARGLLDSLMQMVPALQTGAKLTPQQLSSMQSIAQQLMGGSNTRMSDLAAYYDGLAQRRGIDPQNVLPSYATRRPGSGSPSDLPAAARAELERRQREGAK